jgi:hypothetical protein
VHLLAKHAADAVFNYSANIFIMSDRLWDNQVIFIELPRQSWLSGLVAVQL